MARFVGKLASTAFAVGILALVGSTAEAATLPGDVLAANPAECVGGYRITHQVESRGRITGGVLLRCRS